jgi:hypothetical protein
LAKPDSLMSHKNLQLQNMLELTDESDGHAERSSSASGVPQQEQGADEEAEMAGAEASTKW